jgi:uncharacterized repeat protein (TIGR01451 family)
VAVECVIDRRALGLGFVTVLCVLACLTVAVGVPPARAAPGLCASPGADGPQPTLGGTVNTYFPGISTSVAAGATSLDLGAGIGATTAIAAGDKLLIIQMQAADVNTTNTDAYGDGISGEPPSGATNWGSAGTYELAVAATSVSTVGGTLQLSAGTQNAYATAAATATTGRQAFQVVRIPQFSSATLGSSVTATPWNGSAGGIVALDVAGTLDLNGFRIDVSASGFRGGVGPQLGGGAGGASPDARTSAANAFNGGKAEGVAGTPRYVFDGTTTTDTGVEGYPNGSFARGAPANAGGGGNDGNPSANDQNSGGGGGANGGGGGQGGNSWSSNLAIGGAGGVAVPAASATHVVLGGGGGGATRNNAGPSSGGVGGGLVILDVGSLTGTGEIRANGGDGQTAANDGGGGGGAGGSVVVVTASGELSGLSVTANGGDGGDAWPTQAPGGFPGERHGPGGGGGGGFILLSTSGATTSTNGGAHGVATTASDAYNATDGAGGSAGTFVGSLPGAGGASSCSPLLTVTKTTATANVTNTPSGTTATYTIAVANSAGRNAAEQVAVSDALPAGLTFVSSGVVTLDGGATRALVVNPSGGATSPSWGDFTIPGGGSVSVTFTVDIASSVGASILQNPATATNLDPGRTTVGGTTTTSYDPASSAGEDVRVRWPDMMNPPQSPAAPRADLSLAKTTSSAVVARGDRISYALAVHNDGPDVAVDVVITDTIPAGLTFVSAAGGGWACTSAGPALTCSRPQLAAGATAAVTLVVIAARAGTITNTASVTSSTGDPSATPTVKAAVVRVITRVRLGIVPTRLAVAIKPGFATVASGKPIRFVVRTTSIGRSVAKGVVTCVTIPAGANIARTSGGLMANGRYCWRQASLRSGASAKYVISIRADRRQAQHFALVARAVARNARATEAKARVSVLAAIEKTSGGYTG